MIPKRVKRIAYYEQATRKRSKMTRKKLNEIVAKANELALRDKVFWANNVLDQAQAITELIEAPEVKEYLENRNLVIERLSTYHGDVYFKLRDGDKNAR